MLEETFKDTFKDAYKERRNEITIDVFAEEKWDFPVDQDPDGGGPPIPEYGPLSLSLRSICLRSTKGLKASRFLDILKLVTAFCGGSTKRVRQS
jgi:hypothetical protein